MFILASESFHPLLAEVTHNETADPSMTFHLPEHNVPNSPEGPPAGSDRSTPTPSEEFETHDDPSQSGESPERFRTEEPVSCVTASPALHESFSQLITSQCHPHESVLMLSPTMKTDVELTTLSLSKVTMCDDVGMPKPEVPFSHISAGELKSEQGSSLKNAFPASEKIMVW